MAPDPAQPAVRHPVLRLFGRLAMLAAPVWVAFGWYLVDDPFKVLHRYASYYVSGRPIAITLNRDFVSTETFLARQPQDRYDSFIFGNSRSLFYPLADWQRCLDNSRGFHFDASAESLYGVERKLAFLEREDVAVRNALLIMDSELLAQARENPRYLFRLHPAVSGRSRLAFQWAFIKTFLDPGFIKGYLRFKLTGQGFSDTPFAYEPRGNELRLDAYEEAIRRDPDAFYAARRKLFFPRAAPEHVGPPVIGPEQARLLDAMAAVFRRQQTEFRIVISPLYDQDRLNPADLAKLQAVFGTNRVFDYSGINEITASVTNYYESSHYRPHVARRILADIYATPLSEEGAGSPP